ncbi:hypothetical protein D3C80_1960610 [compost metagenome]
MVAKEAKEDSRLKMRRSYILSLHLKSSVPYRVWRMLPEFFRQKEISLSPVSPQARVELWGLITSIFPKWPGSEMTCSRHILLNI